MGQEVSIRDKAQPSLALATDPTKWIEPTISSCLDSSTWDSDDWLRAKRALAANAVDVPAALDRARSMMAPVEPAWLARRLRALWQSTIPSGSLRADAWLAETGRLLKHLPFDIVAAAIDRAVEKSERGFTPVAGEILAIAKPLLADRRRIIQRLGDIESGKPPRPWEVREKDVPPEERCTPEQAAQILAEAGLRSRYRPEPPREPTQEELEELAREFRGDA